jgi:anti-sigma B factor antagonist
MPALRVVADARGIASSARLGLAPRAPGARPAGLARSFPSVLVSPGLDSGDNAYKLVQRHHGQHRSDHRHRGPPGRRRNMAFSVRKESNGVVVVSVDGQLIVGNRQELKQRIIDALEAGDRKFLVDFTRTGYIDSSGLGVLVSLSKKIRDQGGDLRLAGLNEDLKTLFELTKLDTLFGISDSPDEALTGF